MRTLVLLLVLAIAVALLAESMWHIGRGRFDDPVPQRRISIEIALAVGLLLVVPFL